MRIRSKGDIDALAQRGRRRLNPTEARIQVGTATCGLSKGARETVKALKKAVAEADLKAEVVAVGCNGLCYAEPIAEVIRPQMPKITYGEVTPEKAASLVRAVSKGEVDTENRAICQTCVERSVTGSRIAYGSKIEGIPEATHVAGRKGQTKIVMRNSGIIDPPSLEEYAATGGFGGLAKALSDKNSQGKVIEIVEKSGLRGRGGAAFATGTKWRMARQARGAKKYVVVNASEGDPDAGMHRSLLESDPLSVIEGMMICGFAIGANEGYIYVNDRYSLAEERLALVLHRLSEAGLLGDGILGSDFSFRATVKRGGGAYVSGEETTLINALEGEVTEPRERPPFPATQGLFGMPTVVNSVETLMNIPVILQKGGASYAKYGVPGSRGTKVLSIVGDVERSGVVEVPLGVKIHEIVEMAGGVKDGKKLKAFQVGGPAGGVLPAHKTNLPLDYRKLFRENHLIGSSLVLMDEDTDMVRMARYFTTFFEEESCGKCIPCREGSHRVGEVLDDIIAGRGNKADLDYLLALAGPVADSAACGLGKSLLAPVVSTIKHFRSEYEKRLKQRKA
jgi:NADH-quinone oxidoreductase subunit F